MSGYAVVQFTDWGDGNSVEAVPVSWLISIGSRQMCYYPKTGVKKAIKQCSTPKGDWELHPVKRLSHKDITSFKTALQKENKAMYTSAIDTDALAEAAPAPSRERKRPKRFESSESEEDESMGNKHNEGDLEPPQSDFRLPAAPVYHVAHHSRNVCDAESIEPDPLASSSPFQSESVCHHQPVLLSPSQSVPAAGVHIQPSIAHTRTSVEPIQPSSHASQSQHDVIIHAEQGRQGQLTPRRQPVPAADTDDTPTCSSRQPGTIKEQLDYIMKTVDRLEANQKCIIQALHGLENCTSKASESAAAFDMGTKSLPVVSEEDMNHLSELLENRSKRRQLRSYLAKIGGHDVAANTQKVMKACVTYAVASEYSLLGQRSKKSFAALPLYKIIVQSIMISQPNTKQAVVDDHIMSFLKHAPEKPGCKRYKPRKKMDSSCTGTPAVRPHLSDSE